MTQEDNNRGTMKPQMQHKEVAAMENILSSFGHHVDVLEWGSGGSTVYFTEFLRDKGISYTWTSIEYNRAWYDRISDMVKGDEHTKLVFFDVGNNVLKQRYTDMEEYIKYPATLGKKFDVIFVDGRKRRRCVLEAKKLLRSSGVVLLHDAHRTYYHCAFRAFPDSRFLLRSGLWQGKIEDPGFFRKLINFVAYWCLRAYMFLFRFRPRALFK